MANIKITDLSGYTDPESTDVLPIVDVTNDETKKVSIADLMENAGSGTEALPGIAFDGDPNTGIYRPGADQLAISTAGTQRLLISDTGAITIPGDLTVQGTTTTIDSETLVVKDKNIEMGSVTTPTDTTADGGGITLKGATDKTINWVNSTDAWTSSERFDFPAGTAAAPSIILNGDVNSGIYQPGADQVAVATNGTGRLFIDSAGLVGIGTSSPQSLLHLSGTVPDIRYTDTTGDEYRVGNNNGIFRVYNTTDATTPFAINGAGNVGIGITNPGANLHVKGNDIIQYVEATGTAAEICFRNNTSTGDNIRIGGSGNNLTFDTSGAESMRIDSSGRVGIGTTSPGQLLQVGSANGAIRVGGAAGLDITHNNSGSTVSEIKQLYATTSNAAQLKIISGFTSFHTGTSNTERLRITSSGNVGIGTTSPSLGLLEVSSTNGVTLAIKNTTVTNIGNEFCQLTFNNTSNSFANLESAKIKAISTNGATNLAHLTFENCGLERARIDSSGRLLVGTSTVIANKSHLNGAINPQFEIDGTGIPNATLAITNWNSASASPSHVVLSKSKSGTVGTRTLVANNDDIGAVVFTADDGTAFIPAASILAEVDGTPGANDMPGASYSLPRRMGLARQPNASASRPQAT
jgi:hypothetical protein